ncbi:nodulation S family protein [Pseudomonas sp. COR58]|uniref:Nodulation S family protein n=1 Tax=Pseudomonas ekonensis TaxID=2842353 RepID=A0ABS6PDS0_9PSED|nr:class I SAM-dependent methyltransferase [Pseudomonas ekonensis]MBV4458625.1 nodulation S family protein [Pseudomonas ekonensis]
MSVANAYFDHLFSRSPDPWFMRERWYERRKRDIALAALPQRRYRRGFEAGCANGELSVRLAERCDRLLCCDVSALAVKLAAERLHKADHARAYQARVPDQWPGGAFDLIVISELGYYLDAADLRRMVELVRAALTADGALLACHWRHPVAVCPQTGDQVHACLYEHLHLSRSVRHEEADFLLEVWEGSDLSVADREGLTERTP